MNIARSIDYWQYAKDTYYKWFYGLVWTKKIPLCLLMATITGIAAQIRITVPFTPVPITGQVLAVLLSGVLLGSYFGGLSMVCYFVLGCAGIPWFSLGVPIGPTTGYIIGFIPAALFVGWAIPKVRRFLLMLALMMIAIGICYLFGAIWFAFFMHTGFKETLMMAVIPFIPIDLLKAFIATGLAKFISP